MKHEAIKFNTKKQLSNSLKEILQQKPFFKVTISEIASRCGLNRKTFYYHFSDVRQLLEWTFKQEAVDIFTEYGRMNNFSDAILFTVDYIQKNKLFLANVYNSIGGYDLTEFFRCNFCEVIEMSVSMHEKQLDITVSDNYKAFLCSFYSQALSGQMLELINTDSPLDKNTISNYILMTLSVSIPEVLKEAVESGMNQ